MVMKMISLVAAFFLSALGSAFGVGCAALSAVGGWKKCYASGKPAAFMMVGFAGAPLTQTIYGFLLKNFIQSAMINGVPDASLCWCSWWWYHWSFSLHSGPLCCFCL